MKRWLWTKLYRWLVEPEAEQIYETLEEIINVRLVEHNRRIAQLEEQVAQLEAKGNAANTKTEPNG